MKKSQEELLENEDIEIRLLVQAIYEKYGYDFRNYSQVDSMPRAAIQNCEVDHVLLLEEIAAFLNNL
jgi:hypothetical protein